MPKPKSPKRRLTMKDMKKLFGPSYREPSVEEMEGSPQMSLAEVLAGLEKKHPAQRKAANKSKEVVQIRHVIQKIRVQLDRIEERLVKYYCA